jgi:hypothetical protein
MTTRAVRFQFLCDKVAEGLNFSHPVPESLITPLSKARKESSFHDRFRRAILPFMKEHEAACRAASNPICGSCGSPITAVLQTPMSYLHKAGDPHVAVIVSGVCGKVECEIETRQAIQEEMLEAGAGHESEVAGTCCVICGTREQIKRCGRCKTVGYCGKDHQRADWKRHKRVCVHQDAEIAGDDQTG